MKHIVQETHNECMIACIAMVTGKTLPDVRDGLGRSVEDEIDWASLGEGVEAPDGDAYLGVLDEELNWYLFRHGFTIYTWHTPANWSPAWSRAVREKGILATAYLDDISRWTQERTGHSDGRLQDVPGPPARHCHARGCGLRPGHGSGEAVQDRGRHHDIHSHTDSA